MVFNKRFFDADANEGGGDFFGGEPENPFANAKAGDISIGAENVEPITAEDADKKKDEKIETPDEKPSVETADAGSEESKDTKPIVAEVVVEAPKKEPVETKPQAPVFNFDEELKKVDKYETLKKLGFDEFEIGLLKYKEQTGDLAAYLEAKTVDYSKFSDEQIMKYDLKNQYKGLSDKALELLYEQEIASKFILDADIHGVAAAELGIELMKHKADKIRQSAVTEQAKFKAPDKPVDDSAQRQQQEYEAKIAEYKEYVNDSPDTKALLKDKKLVFGTGETSFNYTVENPQSLVDTAINPQMIFNDLVDDKGNMNPAKFYKVKAYANDPEKIEQMLINHGKTIGVKEYHEGLTNPSKKDAKPAIDTSPELTPWEALAKHGKIRERN